MKKIWNIYFSPLGSTETVCRALGDFLADRFEATSCQYDFTLPSARQTFPVISSDDLAVFAVPTYAGRVPNVLLKYLDTINGNGAKAIALVTFGNRNFDNSLIELADILNSHNFTVAAAGAVGCQHSFSQILGKGRPDRNDLSELETFAENIFNKLSGDLNCQPEAHSTIEKHQPSLSIPGLPYPYGSYYQPRDRYENPIDIRKVTPKVSENCTQCGLCARVCPMGSISFEDVSRLNGICIKCNACIKKCPSAARYFDDAGYLYHKKELEQMYEKRALNSFFV